MTDDNSSTARILRWIVSIAVLMIAAHMNWWLVINGKSENMLHQNAQFWNYITIAAVLAGLGIGESITLLINTYRRPS